MLFYWLNVLLVALGGICGFFVRYWLRPRRILDRYAADCGLRRRRFESDEALRTRIMFSTRCASPTYEDVVKMSLEEAADYVPCHLTYDQWVAELKRRSRCNS